MKTIVCVILKTIGVLSLLSNLITWPIQLIWVIMEYIQYEKGKISEHDYVTKINRRWHNLKLFFKATFLVWNADEFWDILDEFI